MALFSEYETNRLPAAFIFTLIRLKLIVCIVELWSWIKFRGRIKNSLACSRLNRPYPGVRLRERSFFVSEVGFPLYPEIFYFIGSLWEMQDSNPEPLPQNSGALRHQNWTNTVTLWGIINIVYPGERLLGILIKCILE